jgi:hypothetical protein
MFIVDGGREFVIRRSMSVSLALRGGAVVMVQVAPAGQVNEPSPPLVKLQVSSPLGQGFES